jgi:hypothetical protein
MVAAGGFAGGASAEAALLRWLTAGYDTSQTSLRDPIRSVCERKGRAATSSKEP